MKPHLESTRSNLPSQQSAVSCSSEARPDHLEKQTPASYGSRPDHGDGESRGPEGEPRMLSQLPIQQVCNEQLVTEVKGVYTALVMIEVKCIDVDQRQLAAAQEKDPTKRTELTNDQWQSLYALHRQLLHEHYDFFMACQHPSASPALSSLAAKYSMPARMWRHGIYAFLELLRHRLPGSLDHMLTFIHSAYSLMTLCFTTVPTFEDVWMECLGDLARYRMAVADNKSKDRESWSNVARSWYDKVVDKTPEVGRLYHHLAVLACPYTLEQLSWYARALTCLTPLENARRNILTLFNPVLRGKDTTSQRLPFEHAFIRAHGLLFTSQASDSFDQFDRAVEELDLGGLYEEYISKSSSRFKKTGVHAATSNIAALLEYGTPKQKGPTSKLRLAHEYAHRVKEQLYKPTQSELSTPGDISSPLVQSSRSGDGISIISRSSRLAFMTQGITLKRADDRNVYPLVHVYLVFIYRLILVQQAWSKFEDDLVWEIIEKDTPWTAIASFLNTLAAEPHAMTAKVWAQGFPKPDEESGRPLPEDFIMCGQPYSRWYFPYTWFTNAMIGVDDRQMPSTNQQRVERMLWLGLRIASVSTIAGVKGM